MISQRPIGIRQTGSDDTEGQADSLLYRTQENQAEQTALLEATPLESQYNASFTAQLEAKHDQVERIEDKLENLKETNESRLQQIQSSQPGRLSFPSTRAKWQLRIQQQQNLLQRLQNRLELVHEIKDGIGIFGPRIEELATRKLRFQEPELAQSRDKMMEAQRREKSLLREQREPVKQELDEVFTRKGKSRTLRVEF